MNPTLRQQRRQTALQNYLALTAAIADQLAEATAAMPNSEAWAHITSALRDKVRGGRNRNACAAQVWARRRQVQRRNAEKPRNVDNVA